MGRAWTTADQERWRHVEYGAEAEQRQIAPPDDALLRDVVAGCVVYAVGLVLYHLRLAPPSGRTLGMEIEAATAARTFWEWLGQPMVDLPEEFEATSETDG